MTRTIENCSYATKRVNTGDKEPEKLYYLNKCFGFQSDDPDKPCEECSRCKYYCGPGNIKG